jgi:hypothetical protein
MLAAIQLRKIWFCTVSPISNILLRRTDWVQTGFWIIGFIDHLQVVTTNNYNTIADIHTLKSLQHTLACSVFTRRFLVTALTMAIPLLPCSSPLWTAAPFQLNWTSKSKWKLLYYWRFFRLSVRLGVKPHETHDQRSFFFQLSPFCNSPYVTSSLTRRWVCLLWICLAFRQAYVSHL